MTPALEAHDLYRFYHVGDEETLALRGVSLSISAGETVAVIGPSGSGKSTLINCLAGLDDPDGGWVMVSGHRITRRPQRDQSRLRARHVGILLQSRNLQDHLTIGENMFAALFLAGNSGGRIDTHAALEAVGLLGRAEAFPDQLSGGELARASLAVALVNDPTVLLADEPTAEVDAENERALLGLLVDRARGGCATVIVTHSAAVAAVADRVLNLIDGRLDGA